MPLNSQQLLHLLESSSKTITPHPYKVFDDGMAVWVYPMAYGNGRLLHGHADDKCGYERGWCYKSVEAAFQAADKWNGQGIPEGWKKDIQTQEYRKEFE